MLSVLTQPKTTRRSSEQEIFEWHRVGPCSSITWVVGYPLGVQRLEIGSRSLDLSIASLACATRLQQDLLSLQACHFGNGGYFVPALLNWNGKVFVRSTIHLSCVMHYIEESDPEGSNQQVRNSTSSVVQIWDMRRTFAKHSSSEDRSHPSLEEYIHSESLSDPF